MAKVITLSRYLEAKVKGYLKLALALSTATVCSLVIALAFLHPMIFIPLPILLSALRCWHRYLSYSRGLRGELRVLHELRELPDDYLVIHSLPIPGLGDLDFVVVGPSGVYAIEVKNWHGRGLEVGEGVWKINIGRGVKVMESPIPKLKARLSFLRERGVMAKPLLVMAGSLRPEGLKECGVEILSPEELVARIFYGRVKISKGDVEGIYRRLLAIGAKADR